MPQYYFADHFLKQLKPHAKKFRKLPQDLTLVLKNFLPEQAQMLGQKLYKLRLKASDLPKGKSKSFRVIIYIWQDPEIVVPIAIYFKSDIQNLSAKEIKYHLGKVLVEIETKTLDWISSSGRQNIDLSQFIRDDRQRH